MPLELPVTRQMAGILARRREECGSPEGWLFPSSASGSGRIPDLSQYYKRIGQHCGTLFWYHGLRIAFITVAERELMLPASLTKRLVNHARPNDVTQSYAADWTIEQLRDPAQRVADRIQQLMKAEDAVPAAPAQSAPVTAYPPGPLPARRARSSRLRPRPGLFRAPHQQEHRAHVPDKDLQPRAPRPARERIHRQCARTRTLLISEGANRK